MNEEEQVAEPPQGHAYELFILVLTVVSLAIMVVMMLPLGDATLGLLQSSTPPCSASPA